MSPRAFTAHLADGRYWSFCDDCGEAFLAGQDHVCDPLRAARGVVIALAAVLVAYAAVAVGVISWWLA